jgi:anti-sigma28 factor (negative regulator of flagellin synthesis)
MKTVKKIKAVAKESTSPKKHKNYRSAANSKSTQKIDRTKSPVILKGNRKKREIDMIKNSVDNSSYLRADKIALLKDAIKKGEYVVHSTDIADKLIKESILLLYLQSKAKSFH